MPDRHLSEETSPGNSFEEETARIANFLVSYAHRRMAVCLKQNGTKHGAHLGALHPN